MPNKHDETSKQKGTRMYEVGEKVKYAGTTESDDPEARKLLEELAASIGTIKEVRYVGSWSHYYVVDFGLPTNFWDLKDANLKPAERS